jgi:nucleotide sugar dehydrogenase
VPEDGSAVAVVGSGYVGTVVAACFAWLGRMVVAVEADGARLAALSQGQVPFHEPGLDQIVASAVATGRLQVTGDVRRALDSAEIVFLCVGTPAGIRGGADLTAFELAARAIGAKADGHHILVVKSTVPVGSSQVTRAWCEAAAAETGRSLPMFTIVSNPEFLREGSAVEDFLHPDRVVVGGEDECALDRVTELYRPILDQNFAGADHRCHPVLIRTTSATAEMIKYTANAFLATKVSFINEIANICDLVDADVVEVARGIGLDHRIGAGCLDAGLGWGGSCLGKDLAALISHAEEHGYEPELLRATLGVNARQRSQVVERLRQRLGTLTEKRVALLGLAFKPGTDDLRDAPAVGIAQELIESGATVTGYDPFVFGVSEACGLSLAASACDAAEQADAVVIATQWPEFLELDFDKLRARMRGTMLLDGRNCVDANAVAASGLTYQGTGRSVRSPGVAMSTQVRADGKRGGTFTAASLDFQCASPGVSLSTRSSRRVAVTGGAGFLGSHLCEALLARGDRVVCIDNLSTGTAENVRELAEIEGFEFVMADASAPLPVDGQVDAVLHFASPASPMAYLARPLETLAVGSQGTRQALALASVHNARFLLASTSEVYGDPEVHPQTESYWGHVNPVGPRSVYDESKRFAEALTTAWGRTYGIETAIVRIFNTYGPRLQPGDGRVVSNFLVQAIEGRPLTVYGNGSQSRSLCYVDDTVGGVLAVLDSHLAGPVNIGNPTEITVLDLARTVLELTGSASDIVFAPLPVDDPRRRCPDISLARRALNWEPAISLRDGLQHTLEFFVSRNQLNHRTCGC